MSHASAILIAEAMRQRTGNVPAAETTFEPDDAAATDE
jgi:hypothetical protein